MQVSEYYQSFRGYWLWLKKKENIQVTVEINHASRRKPSDAGRCSQWWRRWRACWQRRWEVVRKPSAESSCSVCCGNSAELFPYMSMRGGGGGRWWLFQAQGSDVPRSARHLLPGWKRGRRHAVDDTNQPTATVRLLKNGSNWRNSQMKVTFPTMTEVESQLKDANPCFW